MGLSHIIQRLHSDQSSSDPTIKLTFVQVSLVASQLYIYTHIELVSPDLYYHTMTIYIQISHSVLVQIRRKELNVNYID